MPRMRCSSRLVRIPTIYSRARGGAAESGAAAHVRDVVIVVVVVVASFSARGAITRCCCGCDCVFPLVVERFYVTSRSHSRVCVPTCPVAVTV
uniref:Secreted protein n=1 Tax=Trichogramma kaykai TaxID=54128 RepID=A0ABD2XD61_9HYME